MSIWDDLLGAGDPGGGSLPNFNDPTIDWNAIIGQQPENGFTPPGFTSPGSTYGNADRGLGTGGGSGTDGTLTPGQISNLGTGASGIPGSGGIGGGSGSGGLGSTLGSLLNGVGGPGGLAMLLGPLLSALAQRSNISNATSQLQQGVTDANNRVDSIYGNSKSLYMPYVTGGQQAMQNAQGMAYKPMAGNFAPLSGLTLGNMSGRRNG